MTTPRENGVAISTYFLWQRRVFQAVSERAEVCFAEVKRSPAGSNMGGTDSGVPRQREERPCMVQGKRNLGEDVLLLAKKAISADGIYDRSGKLRRDSPWDTNRPVLRRGSKNKPVWGNN